MLIILPVLETDSADIIYIVFYATCVCACYALWVTQSMNLEHYPNVPLITEQNNPSEERERERERIYI